MFPILSFIQLFTEHLLRARPWDLVPVELTFLWSNDTPTGLNELQTQGYA